MGTAPSSRISEVDRGEVATRRRRAGNGAGADATTERAVGGTSTCPGRVSRSRRRLAKAIKPRPDYRIKTPARPPTAAERITRFSPADVLERITRARLQREELDAELTLLIDHAVALGITWPQIASRLRVTRQAARQQYQRRHRRAASG